jgi:hypothetical protein
VEGLGLPGGNGRTGVPAGQAELWNETVARQNLYHQNVDPPFDPGNAPYHFFLTAGANYFKPHLESNPGLIAFQRQTVGGGSTLRSQVTSLDYGAEFTPKVTLGADFDSGWGIRTTWWHFAEGSNNVNTFNGDPTSNTFIQTPSLFGVPGFSTPGPIASRFQVFQNALSFGSHLETHVWDAEATRLMNFGSWEVLFSGGGRYTYLSQGYSAIRASKGSGHSGTSRVTVTQDSDTVTTGHNFSGFGPTAALEVHRPLWDTGFALYGTGRTSVVFGRGRTHSQQISIENFQVIPTRGTTQTVKTTSVIDNAKGHDDALPIEEVEIGLEWTRGVGRVIFLVQAGVVYQEWTNGGNGSSEKGDFSMFGLSLTAGLTY